MFGRRLGTSPAVKFEEEGPQPVSDLIGGSGVSLDGQSLVIDEISIDNSTGEGRGYQATTKNQLRIVGTAAEYDEEDNRRMQSPQLSPDPFSEPDTPTVTPTSYQDTDVKNQHRSQPPHYERKRYGDGNNGQTGATKSVDSSGSEFDDYDSAAEPYCFCLPAWIADAPMWLKWVIVFSSALLVGAIALVCIGATIAMRNANESNGSSSSGPGLPMPQSAPTPADVDPTLSTLVPTFRTDIVSSPSPPAPTVTIQSDTPSPSMTPPTGVPSMSPTGTRISFMATAGRFIGSGLAALPDQLPTLPNIDGNAMLFHLGDWNSPFATSCDEQSYQTNYDLYSLSSLPVYFVPGDNEFNDCPIPEQAFEYWHEYFLDFETKFWPEPRWTVYRQKPDYPENFAYVFNGVLFIGINLVGGLVHDSTEWENRHYADLEWIDSQYHAHYNPNEYTAESIDAMVVFAHADPDISANQVFFDEFFDRVATNYTDLMTVFVHRNLGVENWRLEAQYQGINNLIVVVVQGSIWPPMLVTIDPRAGIIDIDQDSWYSNYTAEVSEVTEVEATAAVAKTGGG